MLIKFLCPNCDAKLEAEGSMSGQQLNCPVCKKNIQIPSNKLKPGISLGDFLIEENVGEGGMGQVFLAKQKSMERSVALKVLPQTTSEKSAEIYGRFIKEIHMTAKLDHPNIITAYHAGEDDGYYYYAMSYIDGEDLNALVRENGPMPEKDAMAIIKKIACALAYAWDEQKILHRDIKPNNIMIDSKGEVKVLDLGLAKSLDDNSDLTVVGTTIGTPKYISPEQAQGKIKLDCRTDIFSLGATLYFLLSGKHPFDGKEMIPILYKVINEEPPSLESMDITVSPACEKLLKKMMAKERDERPANWNELIQEIEQYETNPDTVTTNSGHGKFKRWQWVSGIALLLLLVLILLLGIGNSIKVRERNRLGAQLESEVKTLIADSKFQEANQRLKETLPSLNKKTRNIKQLNQLLTGTETLIKLDKAVPRIKDNIHNGNISDAVAQLNGFINTLPDSIKLPDKLSKFKSRILETGKQADKIRQRNRDFLMAVFNKTPKDALPFVSPESIKFHGKPKVLFIIKMINTFIKDVELEDSDIRINSIRLGKDLRSANLETTLRIRGKWKKSKPSRWICGKDNHWYVVFGKKSVQHIHHRKKTRRNFKPRKPTNR